MTRSKGPCASDDERKERRRAANRRSARKSRYRETVVLDELQKTVAQLAKQNESLRADNEACRRDVLVLQSLIANRKTQQLEMVSSKWLLRGTSTFVLVPPQCLTKSLLHFQDPTERTKPFHYQSISYVNAVQTYDGVRPFPRAPSPVESLNSNPLDPHRIFPVGGDNMDQQPDIMSMPMGAAGFLFHSAMSAVWKP